MRRTLALLFAAACLLRASPARGEPNDVNLFRLGPPKALACQAILDGSGPQTRPPSAAAITCASDSLQRFALLSTQMGLGLSSMLLTPANTVGHSGFEFGFDFAYVPVTSPSIGSAPDPIFQTGIWPVTGASPTALLLPAFHVRKALPFSFELGGRAIYLTESTMVATQVELKWAINEGFRDFPDVALRGAVTYLFGIPQWDLSTVEAGAIVSKRFGVGGVMSLTPYGAVRMTWLAAKSESMDYRLPSSTSAGQFDTIAAFPRFSERFLRYTLGLRMVAGALTLSAEATYYPGQTFTGSGAQDAYPTFKVPSSITGGANLGFGF